MRALLNLIGGLLVGLAPLAASAAVPDGCGPVNDPQQLARSARIILVGEMHGTREYPTLVARLACQALADGRPVTLALEMPQEEEARLAAYVASNGDARAAALLTAGSDFWLKGRDGRASTAMLVLIEQARRWREQGKPISVMTIDKPRAASGTRDEHMAARVRQAALGAPASLLIALTGNMHNRLVPFGDPQVRIDTPMGVLLRDLDPVSIGNERVRGSFFVCMPDCRIHNSNEDGFPLDVPVIVGATDRGRGPYTHIVEVGRTTAAPPAADVVH
jgi:hypothetical protein